LTPKFLQISNDNKDPHFTSVKNIRFGFERLLGDSNWTLMRLLTRNGEEKKMGLKTSPDYVLKGKLIC
jgi:hypothetical protein